MVFQVRYSAEFFTALVADKRTRDILRCSLQTGVVVTIILKYKNNNDENMLKVHGLMRHIAISSTFIAITNDRENV